MEAIEFVMRSNNRRDLTSSQRACIAVEALEIIEVIKKEAREKQGKRNDLTSDNKLTQVKKMPDRSDTKVADLFGTNRTYYNEANRLKDSKPELFEQIQKV